jgi:hypothetical protein
VGKFPESCNLQLSNVILHRPTCMVSAAVAGLHYRQSVTSVHYSEDTQVLSITLTSSIK